MSDNEIKLKDVLPKLVEDFKRQYNSKYTFIGDKALGDGAYGVVLKARDIDRQLDIVIKFYHDGIIPHGSERGWHLSSQITHRQISPTYTIEKFVSNKKDYKAVVSRFVPGKSLKQVFSFCNSSSEKNKERIADDLAFSFLSSLIGK